MSRDSDDEINPASLCLLCSNNVANVLLGCRHTLCNICAENWRDNEHKSYNTRVIFTCPFCRRDIIEGENAPRRNSIKIYPPEHQRDPPNPNHIRDGAPRLYYTELLPTTIDPSERQNEQADPDQIGWIHANMQNIQDADERPSFYPEEEHFASMYGPLEDNIQHGIVSRTRSPSPRRTWCSISGGKIKRKNCKLKSHKKKSRKKKSRKKKSRKLKSRKLKSRKLKSRKLKSRKLKSLKKIHTKIK